MRNQVLVLCFCLRFQEKSALGAFGCHLWVHAALSPVYVHYIYVSVRC
jgi:hypothetical protein